MVELLGTVEYAEGWQMLLGLRSRLRSRRMDLRLDA